MSKLVCYCFGYSEADIEQDVQSHNGHSSILERIKASKQAGQCRCPETNPLGK
ncbi:MAG: BFD-like (2Fe-2S) protein [Nitrospirae bacterium]|nr:MAG: BFD-like (2Fe-2S) protein [Nitrospirota bacterium]